MFATALRAARESAHLSVAELASRAGTSRAAVADYELGRKVPRFDTAERLLHAVGEDFVTLRLNEVPRARIDADALTPLENRVRDRAASIADARRDIAVLVDSDVTLERLDLTWGQVKTVMGGTTVEGDELSVWRLYELRRSALAALRRIERGVQPALRVVAADRLFTVDSSIESVPRRAMDFLVRSTEAGADPAFMRHLAGAYLAHFGYPWPWVRHERAADYRRALVACRRQGEGTPLVRALLSDVGRD